jgi:integrase/recombinase XerC
MLDLGAFEEYLVNKELSMNTISCYIRDSKVFMDWFSGRTDCGLDKLIQLDAIGYKKHLLNTNKSVVTAKGRLQASMPYANGYMIADQLLMRSI